MPDTIVESAQARLLHALRALWATRPVEAWIASPHVWTRRGSLPCPGRKRSATPNAVALSRPSPTAF